MAVASRARAELLRQHWRDRETSPERTKVWTEPKPRKVPVVYYLSRNGQLEHPHFMEVAVSPGEGLRLRDVIGRMNALRGKGMADAYAWSCKRSYKNGFVWHDLTEDDLIQPTIAHEYVLKGSERLNSASPTSSQETFAASTGPFSPAATATMSSSAAEKSRITRDNAEIQKSRRKMSWSSFDLNEYKVYKNDVTVDAASKAMDASTQTDDRRNWRRPPPLPTVAPEDECDERGLIPKAEESNKLNGSAVATELDRDEISPPPSSSSPETLESLIKADCRKTSSSSAGRTSVAGRTDDSGVGDGRLRATAMLMHLISCGSISAKGDHSVFASVVPHFRGARLLPRRSSDSNEAADYSTESSNAGGFSGVLKLEDKEYFSSSLVETQKKSVSGEDSTVAGFPGLKRSSSYNADRNSKTESAADAEEEDGVRSKCIPRKPKGAATRREANAPAPGSNLGSKRIDDEPRRI